jgi:lysophospholipase L1-like esterase
MGTFIKQPNRSERQKSWYAMAWSLASLLLLLELIFTLYPESHFVGYTYASQNWMGWYWHKNELGYRDSPFKLKDSTKTRVFFLGDSYTAGHGIKNPSYRFADILAQQLGPKFTCYNLGQNGADTRDEFIRLKAYPLKPDVLVWQYYGNDIEPVARTFKTFPSFNLYADLPSLGRHLVEGSYLLNYLYWRVPHGELQPYLDTLKASYRDSTILNTHSLEFQKIKHWCDSLDVKLLCVHVPFMHDLSESTKLQAELQARIRGLGIKLIDLAPSLQDLSVQERVVNRYDAHASKAVQRIIAERLLPEILAVSPRAH